MKSPKFSGKRRKPRNVPLIVRRVAGESMLPALRSGTIVVGCGWFRQLWPGEIVIIRHAGIEKIKRISRMQGDMLFLEGDNPASSTDSRTLGWLPASVVCAKVIWPS